MTIVELGLDDPTYERVKHIAAGRRVTVKALIQDLVQRLVGIETADDPILGMLPRNPTCWMVSAEKTAQKTTSCRMGHPRDGGCERQGRK